MNAKIAFWTLPEPKNDFHKWSTVLGWPMWTRCRSSPSTRTATTPYGASVSVWPTVQNDYPATSRQNLHLQRYQTTLRSLSSRRSCVWTMTSQDYWQKSTSRPVTSPSVPWTTTQYFSSKRSLIIPSRCCRISTIGRIWSLSQSKFQPWWDLFPVGTRRSAKICRNMWTGSPE